MSEQDVINYIRKCTAVLLEKMDQLDWKIQRLELYLNKERNILLVPTRRWENVLRLNREMEKEIANDLEELRREFRDLLRRYER